MRAVLLACGVSVLSTVSVRAQGTVTFANDALTLVTTNDLQGHVGAATSANGTRVMLYYSTAAIAPPIFDEFTFGWTLSSPTAADVVGISTPGRFAGGTRTLGLLLPGDTVWVMARGWTGDYSSWGLAYAAASAPGGSSIFLGTTTAWLQATGDPNGIPPFGNAPVPMTLGPSGFTGLTLSPIPEPSTTALGGLATIAAVFFIAGQRRRCHRM